MRKSIQTGILSKHENNLLKMIGYKFKRRVSIQKFEEDDIESIKAFLVQKKCKIVEANSTSISFELPFLGVGRWETMTGVTAGVVTILSKGNENYLLYKVSILRFFLATCIIMSAVSVFCLARGDSRGIWLFGIVWVVGHLSVFGRQQIVINQVINLLGLK